MTPSEKLKQTKKNKKAEGKHYYESLTACSTKILRMLYSMCKNNKIFLSD